MEGQNSFQAGGVVLQSVPPGLSPGQLEKLQHAQNKSGEVLGVQHAGGFSNPSASLADASHVGRVVDPSWAGLTGPALGWDPDAITLGRKVMAEFLRTSHAYDILPESNKVVVFDTAVPIRLAFYALVEHDTACAPLWDADRCTFTGLLTTSDIVDIMRVFYTPGSGAPASVALSELTIATWRKFAGSLDGLRAGLSSPDFHLASQAVVAAGRSVMDDAMGSIGLPASSASALRRAHSVQRKLIAIDPEDDLLTVCSKLKRFHIHHMPVLDIEQSAVVAILSHKHLLQHVVSRFSDARRLFDVPLYVLGIGSFDDVVVIPTSASVISVLNVLAERSISAVPVVNEAGQVVDVYSRDDVTFLAHDPSLMVLDAPVGEVRRAQVNMMGPSAPLVTCDRMDSLHRALELFGATAGHCERLVCVDEHRRCTGVVSLSDVFAFFCSREPVVFRPGFGANIAGGSLERSTQGTGFYGGAADGLGLALDSSALPTAGFGPHTAQMEL